MTKTCVTCSRDKALSDFYKDPRYKHGVKSQCKMCVNSDACKWAKNNRSKRRVTAKSWRDKNIEHARAIEKQWCKKNPHKTKAYLAKYRSTHREEIKVRRAKWWQDNYPRMKTDLQWYVLQTLRGRLKSLVRHRSERGMALKLLGCSLTDFLIYLESKFEPGMSWQNCGVNGWEIDHVMPCAIFDLTKEEHQKRCFHFSNMQPLWATENRSKGAKVLNPQFPLI